MMERDSIFVKTAFWATFLSIATSVVSIAASQILLGAALLALLLQRRKLSLPAYILPLSLYITGTVIAGFASGTPMLGMPQYKKFFVFLIVLCMVNTFRSVMEVRNLFLTIIGAATLSASWSLVQYWRKWEYAHQHGIDFASSYIAFRITGFMSHWMTFSGHIMIALLILVAFVFFAVYTKGGWRWAAPLVAVLLAVALVLGQTRAMWIGTLMGVVYLLWQKDKRMILALPFLAGAVYFVSPENVQQRVVSIVQPRELDSNSHRKATLAIGWEIVKAHPMFGIGPQMVKYRNKEFVPRWLGTLPDGYYEHLHNIYFQTAAERGIPTLLMLLWMVAWILRDAWRGLRFLPHGAGDARFALQAIIVVIFSILVSGLFENNLGDSEVLLLFLGISQCVYAVVPATQKS